MAEVARVLPPMQQRGGYCAALYHWVPPTISLDDYRRFAEAVSESRA